MDNQFYQYNQQDMQDSSMYANAGYQAGEVKCPGKEITSLVLGINSLFWGSFSILFFWYIALAIVYTGFGIGCGIAAIILHKQVMNIATVTTKKVEIGKKLAIPGIICSAVGIALSVIFIIVVLLLGMGSILKDLYL